MNTVQPLPVQLLVRSYPNMIGLARYTLMLEQGLAAIGQDYALVEPAYPRAVRAGHAALRPLGYDLQTFCTTYPVAAPLRSGAVTHLTAQQMASLYSFRPDLHPSVVTVHDIVPYLVRDDPEQCVYRHVFDRCVDSLAMKNLRRADRVITDSAYTAKTLVEKLGCLPERIRVVPLGCDHEAFRPMPATDAFRARYSLVAGQQYILYVGSENPRKNLSRLLEAFAIVHAQMPAARLIKAGNAESPARDARLRARVQALGLDGCVIFAGSLPLEDLVPLYNAVDVFAFPSLYEGFGLPTLEAMACGTPVVCANATSLPEVVGDAALTYDPYDAGALADALLRVLQDEALRRELRDRGLARAHQFTWERTARETAAVYHELGAIG